MNVSEDSDQSIFTSVSIISTLVTGEIENDFYGLLCTGARAVLSG